MRSLFVYDTSKDSKLSILEKAINLVDKNKSNFGKTKNMSSLEKNRLALNLLSNLKQRDKDYQEVKDKAIGKNMLAQSKQMELKYQRVEVYHDKYTEDNPTTHYKDAKDYKVRV